MTAYESTHSIHQYVTFFVAGNYLGVDVLMVQEVLRNQHLTRVPLAPAVVEGLINLRGQIVPALDLRRVLNLPNRDGSVNTASLVVRTERGAVSLQVDEIDEVVQQNTSSLSSPPNNIDSRLRMLLQGVYKLDSRLLLVLDIRRAVEVDGHSTCDR